MNIYNYLALVTLLIPAVTMPMDWLRSSTGMNNKQALPTFEVAALKSAEQIEAEKVECARKELEEAKAEFDILKQQLWDGCVRIYGKEPFPVSKMPQGIELNKKIDILQQKLATLDPQTANAKKALLEKLDTEAITPETMTQEKLKERLQKARAEFEDIKLRVWQMYAYTEGEKFFPLFDIPTGRHGCQLEDKIIPTLEQAVKDWNADKNYRVPFTIKDARTTREYWTVLKMLNEPKEKNLN